MEGALKAHPSVKSLSRKAWGAYGVEVSICSCGTKAVFLRAEARFNWATLSLLTPQHTGFGNRYFMRAQLQAFPGNLQPLVLCECGAATTARARAAV